MQDEEQTPEEQELTPEQAREELNKQLTPEIQQRLAFLNALSMKRAAQRRGGSHAAHVKKNSASPGSRAAKRMFRRKSGGGGA